MFSIVFFFLEVKRPLIPCKLSFLVNEHENTNLNTKIGIVHVTIIFSKIHSMTKKCPLQLQLCCQMDVQGLFWTNVNPGN